MCVCVCVCVCTCVSLCVCVYCKVFFISLELFIFLYKSLLAACWLRAGYISESPAVTRNLDPGHMRYLLAPNPPGWWSKVMITRKMYKIIDISGNTFKVVLTRSYIFTDVLDWDEDLYQVLR